MLRPAMPRDHDYYVYMVTNFARSVLYIGVTSDLEGRLYEHREEKEGFHDGLARI